MTNPMGLTIPTPGVTTGPEYATEVSDDLTIVASHTHTGASNNDGTQIPTAGLNINEDLSMQSNNLVSARTTRFTSQSAVLAGVGDINETYVVNGNLYYNNASGTPIQITSGVAIYFTNSLNYSVLAVTTNHTINFADIVTVLECNTTSNTIIVTLPAIVSVPTGRLYIVKDFRGTSETHSITINPTGLNTIDQDSNYVIKDNHASVAFVSDGVGNWSLYPWNRKVYGANDIIKLTNGASLTSDALSTVDLTGDLNATVANITNANIIDADIVDGYVANNFNVNNFIGGFSGGTLKVNSAITSPSYLFNNDISLSRAGRIGGAADPSAWLVDNNGLWENAGLGLNLQFNFNPPNGVKITSVIISFKGVGGHGALPANMPVVTLKRYDLASQLDLTAGSQTDTSINTAAFQLQHNITISGLTSIVNSSSEVWHIIVTAESGANSIVGANVFYYKYTYTILAGSNVGQN